jgi:hypothetical protein
LKARAAVNFFEKIDMAESDNILTKSKKLFNVWLRQLFRPWSGGT